MRFWRSLSQNMSEQQLTIPADNCYRGEKNTVLMIFKRISLLVAVLFCLLQIIFAHSMVKLPSEPFWDTPWQMYENFAFAIALGLSLPAPYITGLIILLLMGWISYRITHWVLRKLSGLVARN